MTDKKHDEDKAKEAEDRKVQADVSVELEKADKDRNKPDNTLPTPPAKPDNTLPSGGRVDNALPGDQPGIDNTLPTPPVAQVCPTCGQRITPPDLTKSVAEQMGGS